MSTLEERRLRAVKSKFTTLIRECECCKEGIIFEDMWTVERWGENKKIVPWYYCTKCMRTANDVLNQVYKDTNPFGIAFVDLHMKPIRTERAMPN